jgi:hypothetical protein
MTAKGSFAFASVATTLAALSSPLPAQPSTGGTSVPDRPVAPQGRTVTVPGNGTVYIVPVPAKDKRKPRQRCVDEEVAREGGSPSELAMGAIDLKCSQR